MIDFSINGISAKKKKKRNINIKVISGSIPHQMTEQPNIDISCRIDRR